jgi:hypothetical protein
VENRNFAFAMASNELINEPDTIEEPRRRRKKQEIKVSTEPTCGYCYNYRYSPKLHRTSISLSKVRIDRTCVPTQEIVNANDLLPTTCDNFRLTKYFWCEEYGNFISVEVCMKRYVEEDYSCGQSCRQAREVEAAKRLDKRKNWKLNFARLLNGEEKDIKQANDMKAAFRRQ